MPFRIIYRVYSINLLVLSVAKRVVHLSVSSEPFAEICQHAFTFMMVTAKLM